MVRTPRTRPMTQMARLRNAVNNMLDTLPRPYVSLFSRRCSAFHLLGLTGLACAVVLCTVLMLHLRLPLWVLGLTTFTALATFLTLAMAAKVISGEERLVYYHHEVAILVTAALALWLVGQPVAAHLDVTILGVGLFLVFGRAGCFMVGCCHGRAGEWGVRYRSEHAQSGFPGYYVGVRIFPVQLLESAWVLLTVAAGVALLLRGAAPGAALAWYVITYDIGRFCFEFLRGDPERPYRLGFSEAQWTSLLLMVAIVGAELAGMIPFHGWHVAATAGIALTMAAVTMRRLVHRDQRHRLLSASHVQEVARAVERLLVESEANPVAPGVSHRDVLVAHTSAGLRISTGRVRAAGNEVRHYTLSSADGSLRMTDIRAVADLLSRLQHATGMSEVVPGRAGIFHLILRSPAPVAASFHSPRRMAAV